jgi:hypothetical protein
VRDTPTVSSFCKSHHLQDPSSLCRQTPALPSSHAIVDELIN